MESAIIHSFFSALDAYRRAKHGFWLFLLAALLAGGSIGALSWEQLSPGNVRSALCMLPPCAFLLGAAFPLSLLRSPWIAAGSGLAACSFFCAAGLRFLVGTPWAEAIQTPIFFAAGSLGACWGLTCHLARLARTKPSSIFLSAEASKLPSGSLRDALIEAAAHAIGAGGWTAEPSALGDTLLVRAKEIPELWISIYAPETLVESESGPDSDSDSDSDFLIISLVWQPVLSLSRVFKPSKMADLASLRSALAVHARSLLPQATIVEIEG